MPIRPGMLTLSLTCLNLKWQCFTYHRLSHLSVSEPVDSSGSISPFGSVSSASDGAPFLEARRDRLVQRVKKVRNGRENCLIIFACITFYLIGNENSKVRNEIRSENSIHQKWLNSNKNISVSIGKR
jgi:hypothetical protein